MAKKPKSNGKGNNKTQEIGSNMTLIIALALLIVGYYAITHWFITGLTIILLLIVAIIGGVIYLKSSIVSALGSLGGLLKK